MQGNYFRLGFFLLCSVSWVLAQQPSALVGTWVGKVEGFAVEMKFVLKEDGTADFDGVPGSWRARDNKLYVTEEGDTIAYDFKLQGSQLMIAGGDLMAPLVLSRFGSAPPDAGQGVPADSPHRADEAKASTDPPAKEPSRSAPESPYTQKNWGVSFVVPEAWQVADRKSALLLGSNSEAGLMIVRFERKTTLTDLTEGYQQGIEEEGVRLMPASQLTKFTANQANGLAGELSGMSRDGKKLRGRVIGVLTPYGDAVVVLGLTTEEPYPALKARVDALGGSLSFSPPQTPPVLEFLAGRYWYFYSSSIGGSYSNERRLTLCSNGRFSEGGEVYSSGDAGIAAGQSGNGGQWTAEGDERQGTIFMNYDNGKTAQQDYRVSTNPQDQSGYGPALILGGSTWQRTGDGTCQ